MTSLEYLKSKKIQFKEIHLTAIPRTASEVVQIFGCPIQQVLKTLIFIGKKPILVVLQGNKKADIDKIKKLTNDMQIRMATPSEIKDLFNVEIGNLSPFMQLKQGIKIIDVAIFSLDTVNTGSELPGIGIEITIPELRNAWEGQIGNISK